VTTGPGDEKAAVAAGRGHLRASHADREHVIGTLKTAFVQGRLTKDEFDLRIGQVFAARTYAELAAVTADVPAWLTGAQPLRRPARARARPPMNKVVLAGACAAIGPAAVAADFLANNEAFAKFCVVIVMVYFMAWLIAGAQILDSWHQKRSRGQLPPRPAQRGQALEGKPDGRRGDDLILYEARKDARARQRTGHRAIQRTCQSLPANRHQRRPANQQVTA
jgi:hypothetical protein